MTATSDAALFNPFAPEFRRDPHPSLARLRAFDPVHKTPFGWIITRHADVQRLNRDPRCGRDTRKLRGGGMATRLGHHNGLVEMLSTIMFHLDPPDHTRIRKLMAYAFTPKAVEQMEVSVEQVARGPCGNGSLDGSPGRPRVVTIAHERLRPQQAQERL